MESLHAPWRIEYILAPRSVLAESLFSRIAQSNDDEANYVIARERTCFALLNTYPYTGGHLMVVPYKQVEDLNGLTDEELTDLMKLTRRNFFRPERIRSHSFGNADLLRLPRAVKCAVSRFRIVRLGEISI